MFGPSTRENSSRLRVRSGSRFSKAMAAMRASAAPIAPAAAELRIGGTDLGGNDRARAVELIDALVRLESDREAYHEAGTIGADLLSRGEGLGATDLFIAAITKRHGHCLLTRDRSFARVRGLTVETY